MLPVVPLSPARPPTKPALLVMLPVVKLFLMLPKLRPTRPPLLLVVMAMLTMPVSLSTASLLRTANKPLTPTSGRYRYRSEIT